MQSLLSTVCCAIFVAVIVIQVGLKAQEEEGDGIEPACTKEELMTFFPKQVVRAVLMRFQIPKDQATAIARALAAKNEELILLVEEKAAQLNPNPFKDLNQRDQAIKIYQDTLHEVFAQVLKEHHIQQEDQIDTYLDEIRRIKSKLFVECIRRQQLSNVPPPSAEPALS